MKVVYLTWGYPSPAAPYAGSFFRNQVEALSDLGVEVEVVAPVPWVPRAAGCLSRSLRRYCRTPRTAIVGSARVSWPRYFVPAPKLWSLGVLHHFVRPVIESMFATEPNLVHVHGGSTLGIATSLVASRYRIPTVLTVHGSDVNVYPELSAWHRAQFQRAVTSATRVFTVSEALADRTVQVTGIRPDVLPIGVDRHRFSAKKTSDKCSLRARLGLPLDGWILLFVGNLTPAKGVVDLVEALRELQQKDVHCVFVGAGPLLRDASKLTNTTVVGQIANERVPEYMAAADVLVLPSHSEGMPTVIVEAGMMGLSVIATSVGGIPELLCDGRGILVPALQPQKLREAITFATSNPKVLSSMSATLQRHVQQNYDVAENAKRLLDVYEQVVSGSVPGKVALA